MSSRLGTTVILVATLAWAGSLLASILVPGWKPPEEVNGVFTVVVGGAVAAVFTRRNGGGEK